MTAMKRTFCDVVNIGKAYGSVLNSSEYSFWTSIMFCPKCGYEYRKGRVLHMFFRQNSLTINLRKYNLLANIENTYKYDVR